MSAEKKKGFWGRVMGGLGNLIRGGQQQPMPYGGNQPGQTTFGMPVGGVQPLGMGGPAGAPGIGVPGSQPFTSGPDPTGTGGNDDRGRWGKAWDWAKANPDTILGAAGLGANIYGARQAGKAEDRRMDMEGDRLGMEQRRLEMAEEERQRDIEREERIRGQRQMAFKRVVARRTN